MADADLRTYLRVLRRRGGWVLLATVLVVAAVVGIDHARAKRYTASAQLLVQPASTVSNAVTQQTVSSTQVLTELQLLTSAPVKALVQHKLGEKELADVPLASGAEIGQTNVISVSATRTTPQEAANIANAYANAFVTYERTAAIASQTAAESQLQSQINTLDRQIAALGHTTAANASSQITTLLSQEDTLKADLAQLQAKRGSSTSAESQLQSQITALASQITALQPSSTSANASPQLTALLSQEEVLKEELAQLQVNGAISSGNVQLVSPAVPPIAPSSPKPLRDVLIAVILGLLLGIALALLVEHLDDAVYGKEDAEQLSGGAPVLALVPRLSSWKAKEEAYLVAVREPMSPVTEAYRSLRTALQFAGHDGDLKTILVTSPSAGEGKTATVANLGVVLAGANQRVVLVGCDLRRPRLGKFLGIEEQSGFTSVLLGERSLEEAVKPVPGVPDLFMLASGAIPPNPAELLAGARGAEVFQELRKTYDVVVIDSPPLIAVTDALILSEIADATLVVVAFGETTKGELQRASELLAQVKARHVGVVLNEVTRRAGYGYGYGYRYEYASAAPSANGRGAEDGPRDRQRAPTG